MTSFIQVNSIGLFKVYTMITEYSKNLTSTVYNRKPNINENDIFGSILGEDIEQNIKAQEKLNKYIKQKSIILDIEKTDDKNIILKKEKFQIDVTEYIQNAYINEQSSSIELNETEETEITVQENYNTETEKTEITVQETEQIEIMEDENNTPETEQTEITVQETEQIEIMEDENNTPETEQTEITVQETEQIEITEDDNNK